ncbi:acylphosphatase [Vibrio sp. SCSIO 43136]|uniref:acylphosphatase n=1 Tax=Vibrio sp. SCSIO 43136 TaxID=2819101 RepID=UPI002075ACBF|nr:acylphosphatase [Vibrio sp. SCSIO 43136]USD64003.1 acylphosphatase [Vibrio sp. SCSIO 43136]
MDKKCVRFCVKGLVQGVGFRYHTAHQGHQLGLNGYAKNLNNGDVEVKVTGSMDAINKLALWLENGPRTAQVDSVTAEEVDYIAMKGFDIL